MPPRRLAACLPKALRLALAAAIATVVLTAVACASTPRSSEAGATPHASASASPTATTEVLSPVSTAGVALPPISPEPALLERATVLHVVDGDTIDVDLNGVRERVRYYGIDTPERGQHCFKEATVRNTELIDSTVLLLPDARERDRYGRLLRYVFDSAGHSVDERLIAEGFAHAWQQDGAYRDMLVVLENDAHALAVGCLWSP